MNNEHVCKDYSTTRMYQILTPDDHFYASFREHVNNIVTFGITMGGKFETHIDSQSIGQIDAAIESIRNKVDEMEDWNVGRKILARDFAANKARSEGLRKRVEALKEEQ